eukprot:11281299-Alexandrium_andersonii.AAC.1
MVRRAAQAVLLEGPRPPHGHFGDLLRPPAGPSVGGVLPLPRLRRAGPHALQGAQLRHAQPGDSSGGATDGAAGPRTSLRRVQGPDLQLRVAEPLQLL